MSCNTPVSSHTEQSGFGRSIVFIRENLRSKYSPNYRLIEVLGTSGVGEGGGGGVLHDERGDERGRTEYLYRIMLFFRLRDLL